MQYFRTPHLGKAAVKALSGLPDFNVEASWGLMRTIYATNMGAALLGHRQTIKFTFLSAQPGNEFIAGDQPLINMRAVDLPEGTAPTETELYYPLSPTLALLMDLDHSRNDSERQVLTAEEVRAYNRKIAKESEEQVFAASEAVLNDLVNE